MPAPSTTVAQAVVCGAPDRRWEPLETLSAGAEPRSRLIYENRPFRAPVAATGGVCNGMPGVRQRIEAGHDRPALGDPAATPTTQPLKPTSPYNRDQLR